MARTRYAVSYGKRAARFSDLGDAHRFAAWASYQHGGAEIIAPDGIVGQYLRGHSTPEFEEHRRAALAL